VGDGSASVPASTAGRRAADFADRSDRRCHGAAALVDVTPAPAEGEGEADLQNLVFQAVEALADRTGASRVVAWGRNHEGIPTVLAARVEGSELGSPSKADWEDAVTLVGAQDLGAPEVSKALFALGRRTGFGAAAPIPCSGEEPPIILLLGDDREPPGAIRPRSLAALVAAARRLAGPAAAEAAARRLAALDTEIQRIDRLASLGGLVAEIVHEIRNPMVSVKTFLQLLPERGDDEEFKTEFHGVALEEMRRIERLLNVVLQNAHPGGDLRSGQAAPIAPALEPVAQLAAFRAADRSVSLEVEASDLSLTGAIAPDALRQVLLNLVLNAIDATPVGGRVLLRAVRAGGEARITVEDDGPGVPKALRARIFEPFYTTKGDRPGGLGLAVCHRLVSQAGGSLSIEDALGGGAEFVFTVPAGPDADSGDAPSPEEDATAEAAGEVPA
jgi:signal transduction histidine kinase